MPLRPRPHAVTAPHPIHALFGSFPVTCFTGALVTDIAYARTADLQWATFSVWLLTAGLVMGGLAILAGIAAFLRDRVGRGATGGGVHGLGTVLAMLLAFWNVFIHSRDGWTSVVPTGLILSIVTVVVMAVTGFAGHALGRRRQVGVAL